jgi:hypothetical protein
MLTLEKRFLPLGANPSALNGSKDSVNSLPNPNPSSSRDPAASGRSSYALDYQECIRRSWSTTNVVEAVNGRLELMHRDNSCSLHYRVTEDVSAETVRNLSPLR